MTENIPEYDSWNRPPRAVEELTELWRNPVVIQALIERNLKVRYKRAFLGVIWSLLNPLAMMVVLTIAFSRLFATEAPRYALFAFSGLLVWNFFSQTTLGVVGEMAAGVELWRRVRVPRTAIALAGVVSGLVHLGAGLLCLLVVLLFLGALSGMALVSLVPILIGVALFTLGFALLAGAAALFFPDVAELLGIALTAWMFVTPVIYPLSIVGPRFERWIRLNPMTTYVEAFRDPLYRASIADGRTIAVALGVGVVTLLAGWLLFARCAHDITRHA